MLLTYFSEVLLGRLDLDPTLKWEISFDHGTGRERLIEVIRRQVFASN